MNTLLYDLRYALRQMRNAPSFTLIALLTLALGVGAATAIYSVVDAVILNPLPYHDPGRIFIPQTLAAEGYTQPSSWPEYLDMRAMNHSFSDLAGFTNYTSTNLQTPSGPVSLNLVASTANFFKVFGVQPILGRTYLPDEDEPGHNQVAVLSYEVWKSKFNGDRNIVGRKIDLNGSPYTCIGVMPAGFMLLGTKNAIYAPILVSKSELTARGDHWLLTIARLKPGIAKQQAQADMNRVLAVMGRMHPDKDAGRKVQLINIAQATYGGDAGTLWVLVGAVLALLAIACVNLAGLLLARSVKREREMALRTAIGATKLRVIRQVLTENLALAFFGAIGGIALAALLLTAMRSFLINSVARGANARIEWKVLLAALLLAILTSLLAALVPALRLSATSPNEVLKAGASAGSSIAQHRLRSGFFITQIALSLVLLAFAASIFRSITNYRNENLGFDPHHIVVAKINLSATTYKDHNLWSDFYQPLLERVQHLPGVKGAGLISLVPIVDGSGINEEIHITGQPPYPPNDLTLAEIRFVSPGYFNTMGIHLLRGRMLSPSLDSSSNHHLTIVVNQAFVKKFIPSSLNPVGQHLDDATQADQKTEIVGTVSNVTQNLIWHNYALPEMDALYTEFPPNDRFSYLLSTNLIVRTAGDPAAIVPSLNAAVHSIDPTVPVVAITMDQSIANHLILERMMGWLFAIFAGLALFLALAGLYGLIRHEVELRTRDIGIRIALGATRSSVLLMILRRVFLMLIAGIATGLLLTFFAQKLVGSTVQLSIEHQFGMMLLIAFTLLFAGLLAALQPANRAAHIEPMEALRLD